MSDTPRTDEQINGKPCTLFEILAGDSLRNASVLSEFARGLERELNTANQRIKRLEEELMDMKNKHAVLVADVALYEDKADRIKRLEEAGNALLWYFCPKNTGDISFLQSEAIKQWNKAKEAKP